jgi:hypothetical protein
MWIEIKIDNHISLLNSKHITYISKDNLRPIVYVDTLNDESMVFEFDSKMTCDAFIHGFILVLNGMDFSMGEGENYVHMKPLKDDANESLYKYMKLKELLGDRK